MVGADFNGTASDRGAVAISFVGGADGHHNGFYVVDSSDLGDGLPFVVARMGAVGSATPWKVNMPRTEMSLGGDITINNRGIGGEGRGQIIFNSDDPGTFGSTTSGYNTINTNSRKGYIGIYGGPNWDDGGAIEVTGADFYGTESDRGAVAISFVGGTDGRHNGFYVVDSTDLNDLPLAIKKVSNSTTTPWRADMRRIDLVVQRSIYASHFYYTSDERLKNNVSEIGNALDKIDQLKGVSFSWKDGGKKSMGFLAQEVEKVFPELVSLEKEEDPNSYKSVEYANLTAPLVEAVKELKKRDETNKQKITELESAIGDLRMEIEQLKNK
ncbi:MAG: hypothetical protein COZ85_00215 [Candidatus Moranbacteria bacterium CG_4_8_14_3_um_filter_34_16]|nr:MAG: hypothetical protein COZ85_00215 [Candidatus Moranbacteria bacterium CG_4_8_14_3_um_filter_34_16]